ncbi:sensor histidine kinase [Dermacoccus barathri]|uniref:histidine kinase n=1 Tax=Dermacoccus barathri TaxID=322601 RepID=A0ABN2AZE2_9MICO
MSAHPPPSATARRPETARAIRAMQAAMHVLFVLLFVVGLARALLTQTTTAPHLALLFVASALFMGLYCFGLTLERRPVSDARREQLAQVWISALVVAWIALLAVAADFAWLAFAFYFLVLYVARRALAAALVAVVLVASVVALASSNSTRGPGSLIGPFMGMLVALGIAWVYVQLRRENDARNLLVDQLVAAQDAVLAAQEELAHAQHRAGVLAERERLARDIHDTLAQGFSSILLLARAGLAREDGDRTLLCQIEEQAAEGLTQSREVARALAPTELADAPLFAALRRLAERLAERLGEQTGIAVSTTCDGDARPLPSPVEVALLRIAQSGLANVRIHAQASRAGVTLVYSPTDVTLEIIDDGVGFDEAAVERAPLGGSGFGLRAIRSASSNSAGSSRSSRPPVKGRRSSSGSRRPPRLPHHRPSRRTEAPCDHGAAHRRPSRGPRRPAGPARGVGHRRSRRSE